VTGNGPLPAGQLAYQQHHQGDGFVMEAMLKAGSGPRHVWDSRLRRLFERPGTRAHFRSGGT